MPDARLEAARIVRYLKRKCLIMQIWPDGWEDVQRRLTRFLQDYALRVRR
jgi:hypothetical protein